MRVVLMMMTLFRYYMQMQDYNVDGSLWLLTEIFVPQLFVCLFVGLIGCLTLELPFGKLQKIIIQYLVTGK